MFDAVASLIARAVERRAAPAAVVEVGRHDGPLWAHAFGRLTYAEEAPRAGTSTIFDLASLTKVLATTPLTMRAVAEGRLSLDTRVADRLSSWRGSDRGEVTVRDLLEHASGLTAYLPFFRDHHGRADFETAIGALPLEYAPRTRAIYSDLGFMLLGFILEDAFGVPFAALTASPTLTCNPPRDWRERIAPTELDLWRGRLLQGEVHDENTWALGGAAGHAGLFGTAAAVGDQARGWLEGVRRGDPAVKTFLTRSTVPASSRALGWDTMLPTSSCGTRLSTAAFGHTGFTGTSLWIDPARDLYVVLLTNRVHPMRDNNQIRPLRRAVHDAVVQALDG